MGLDSFYHPTPDCLDVLNTKQWICSYSGGKDSTSVVTWIEYLRRSNQIQVEKPKLVMSDTGVEYPFLVQVSQKMIAALSRTGWQCKIVTPRIQDKLYNQIFGRGLIPVHPAYKGRWCTRSTKVDPMKVYAGEIGKDVLMVSGVRWGESQNRDQKLSLLGCQAGGECGLPSPESEKDESIYSPIINWRTCQVVDWLSGMVEKEVKTAIKDLLAITKELIEVYDIEFGPVGFGLIPPVVTSLRFGCIGCPAVAKDKVMEVASKKDALWNHVKKLYGIWERMRNPRNRVAKEIKGQWKVGPTKLKFRQQMYQEFMDIQRLSGVLLVNEQDQNYIHKCWEHKAYPRGWSDQDEKHAADRS